MGSETSSKGLSFWLGAFQVSEATCGGVGVGVGVGVGD